MKIIILGLLALAALPAAADNLLELPAVGDGPDWVIAIHGGAGGTTRASLAPEAEDAMREDLRRALDAGAAVLDAGGTGSNAIVAALTVLEDSPHFNAGRGAALDEHGRARHDASIMRGEDLGAGAIAGSSRIRNPIEAALAVMERTANVMLAGDGADWFASEQGLGLADPMYFITEERRRILLEQRAKGGEAAALEPDGDAQFGTVGAVVLDTHGNLAAGTSTGGRTNKRFGRIGDSPVIGAGTYAANSSCAVSATGHGEYFMRYTVARDICARVELRGDGLDAAVEELLVRILLPAGGTGGVAAIDPAGTVVFGATTANLKRGVATSDTPPRVAVYSDEQVR